MSRRHESFYNDPYDHHDPHDALDYERRRPSSRSRHRGDRFSRALEQGYVHEARDIAKSVLLERRPERGTHREHYGRRGRNSTARGEERRFTYNQDPEARPRRSRSVDVREGLDDYHHREHLHHPELRRRYSSTGRPGGSPFAEAATAAAAAGLFEAVRARHNPNRSTRAVTAAVGAAAKDALVSKGEDRKQERHIVESAIGGLAIDRVANGSSSPKGFQVSRPQPQGRLDGQASRNYDTAFDTHPSEALRGTGLAGSSARW